jgi:hypothetical protein
MRGTLMPVPDSGERVVAKVIPSTGDDTDRWNAVALVVLLLTLTAGALVHLVLRAAGS